MASKNVAFEIPAQPEFVRLGRLILAGVANAVGFNVDELDDLKLALGEACYQAFQAGASKQSRLQVSVDVEGNLLQVEVCLTHTGGDTPVGYPGLEGHDRGIGLTLMKHLVDELNFTSNSKRTCIRFTKLHSPRPAEATL